MIAQRFPGRSPRLKDTGLQQLLTIWLSFDSRRRMIVALTTIAMFAAVISLSRIATTPGMSLLYSGLEPRIAGEVVQSLEQQGAVFEIRNDAIFVDSSRRDQLRMQLAGAGLPANNGQGYEILDTLTGFGTTAQMFDAAYWRAKEGELARTIAASPQFRAARVHISNATSRPFRNSSGPSASVTVAGATGTISSANAKALKFLVSSAVAGMTVADVSIIDSKNGVVVSDDSDAASTGANDRAAEMKTNLERMLAARVGPGNVIVEVFMDTSTESESIRETVFDPDSRVAISTETEERSTNSNNSRGSAVTVASNLPEGDAGGNENTSSDQNSETVARTNFEVSETTREVLRAPGAIRRLSIAVLVDGVLETDATTNAQTWAPRSDAELADLRELVASAAGIDEGRGDTLTLKTLQFQTIDDAGPLVEISWFQNLNISIMRLIQLAVLSVVSLVLGLFVLRPIMANAPVPALPSAVQEPAVLAATPAVGIAGSGPAPTVALTGEIDDREGLPPGLAALRSNSGTEPVPSAMNPVPAPPADPVERLRTLINDRQDESVEILRGWIDTKGETT